MSLMMPRVWSRYCVQMVSASSKVRASTIFGLPRILSVLPQLLSASRIAERFCWMRQVYIIGRKEE